MATSHAVFYQYNIARANFFVLIAVAMVTWHNVVYTPGQEGSFLDFILTVPTSKVNDFLHYNQVIDTVHQIIYHPAKFPGSTP